MAILCDTQIRELIGIEPFEENLKRGGTISFGVSSYGYDLRVGPLRHASDFSAPSREIADDVAHVIRRGDHLHIHHRLEQYGMRLAREIVARVRGE